MDSLANHANQDTKLTSVTQSVKETDQYVLETQSFQLMAFHVLHANQDIKPT
jgi:UDP-N-acetylmuramoylalanine-D-glutamate ligase